MKKIRILLVLIILILCVGMTYSVFQSSAHLSVANQELAKFVFNVKKMNNISLPLLDFVPGEEAEYLFSVSNNEDDNRSEVTIEYEITIKTYHFMPLVIALYQLDDEKETFIAECNETYSRNEQNELVCNMPVQEMDFSKDTLDNYKLKVKFPTQYNDSSYANLVDFIELDIKSWQKL